MQQCCFRTAPSPLSSDACAVISVLESQLESTSSGTMTTTKLRTTELRFLDDVFDMSGGYVLDFTNATFAAFFEDEIGVDIYQSQFAVEGTSKAKRLRFFLRKVQPELAAKTIAALWDYRTELVGDASPQEQRRVSEIVARLSDGKITPAAPEEPMPEVERPDEATYSLLRNELIRISDLAPQERGYAFERFLKWIFDEFGLGARASFRLHGEQIDGSFEQGNETYLLEAKWQNTLVSVADLRAFNAKVEDKAKWSRGLFVSHGGYSEQGLAAFGKGNSIICMNGFDLHEMLERSLDLGEVIALKARRAAESGNPFVMVRELFP